MADASFQALRVQAEDAPHAERLAAEAFEAGAAGLEERGSAGEELIVYVPTACVDAVASAVTAAGGRCGDPEAIDATDWSEAWKESLVPIVVSERLVVRPSFTPHPLAPGQREVVIDPGQAFGTGGHESTRLALAWIDAIAPTLPRGTRVLDVGTGSGVLALAALALGADRAVGHDLDPLSPEAAREAADQNGRAEQLAVFTGGIEALAPATCFALVVANLLRRELEPILADVAARVAPGGSLVLSGLLAAEGDRVETLAGPHGLIPEGRRTEEDASGEHWLGLLMRKPSA